MNKHFLIGLSLIAVTLASCSKREIELDETDPTMIKAITESLIEASATSKSEKVVLWNPGDEIAVFSGELSGKFESTLKKKPSSSAVFKGDLGLEAWPEEMDIWAVYPYSEEASFDGETITTVLPSEQIAKDGAFGKDMNLAIAHSNTSILQFYNVGGGIRFSVTEEGIKKVIFEGLNGEIISGKVKIGFSEDGLPEIRKVVSGSQFITILPPDGQETFQKDTWYYIVVIPGSLERGYKLRFYKDSDYARKVSDNSMKIKRNFYRDLENADEGIEYEATTMHFPETEEEILASAYLTKAITEESQSIFHNAKSSNGIIDVTAVTTSMALLDGVVSASLSSDETVLSVMQKDSVIINYLLYTFNDKTPPTKANKATSRQDINNVSGLKKTQAKGFERDYSFPNGKKALILAPFQHEFDEPLKLYSDFLETCGFSTVDVFENEAADITKFTGSFLERYDAILVSTHGSNQLRYKGLTAFTALSTGTEYTPTKVLDWNKVLAQHASRLMDEWFLTATEDKENKKVRTYFSMSNLNLKEGHFDDAFIFLSACRSGEYLSGNGSLMKALKDRNAGVVVGFNFDVDNDDATLFTKKLLYYISIGGSIGKSADVTFETVDDIAYLKPHTKFLPTTPDSYYLFDPRPFNLKSDIVNGHVFLSWSMPLSHNYYEYSIYFDDQLVVSGLEDTHSWTTDLPAPNRWRIVASITIDNNGSNLFVDSYSSEEVEFTANEETIPVKSISLDKADLELAVGNTSTLKATILPSNATNTNVTWSSSNTSVASVSSVGEVKGIAKGTATITVKTEDGGKTATCRVTVVETKVPVSGVNLNKTSLSMAVGDTQTLTATVTPSNATDKSVTWSSSNTSVATVSSSGVVTAKSAGSVTITVTTNDGGKKATCAVTVKVNTIAVSGVSLNKTSLSMTVGETQTLVATVDPSNATDKSVTWSSNNTSVATVSSSGAVTAKSAGNTTIIVKTNDGGKTATCSVTVTNPSPSLPVPDAVDLGLSVKWASFNIGASLPEEYGDYYAWGETEPYYSSLDPLTWKEGKEEGYDWKSYKWCMGEFGTITKYCLIPRNGYNDFSDDKTVLDLEDDVAHVYLGDKWRMPTNEEMDELIHNCSWERVSVNGIDGRKATGPNGNSIFLPAAGIIQYRNHYLVNFEGRYWSSSLGQDVYAYSAMFDNNNSVKKSADYRFTGFPVRPVYGVPESVSLNKSELVLSVGESVRLVASVISNALDQSVTWSSSDVFVAMASSDGVVTGIAPGTSIITVSTNNLGRTATCSITVQDNPSSGPVPVAIDLGLSVKWAAFNLGATRPEGYGDYYAWGETEPYYSSQDPLIWKEGKEKGYSWSSYYLCMGSHLSVTKYCTDSHYGYNGFTDDKTVLDPEDDAAHVNLGGKWRMPTINELSELRSKCTWEWIVVNGITGNKVIGPNGNCIFLPAAGHFSNTSTPNLCGLGSFGNFWSSSLYTDSPMYARSVQFSSGIYQNRTDYSRSNGLSIRPVYDDK